MALCIAFTIVCIASLSWASEGQLQFGFYSTTCPDAEDIVTSLVRKEALSRPNLPAVLLRLHYHDCIVQGCDGSILINEPDSPTLENRAQGHQGVEGIDVIDKIKARIEQECPEVVSCADIVALAARDSVFLANGPGYAVPTGRRDGFVSNIQDAGDMPDVSDSLQELIQKFSAKGLSETDLVLLSGAHTIGRAACFFVTGRLYDFPESGSDPSINPRYLPELMSMCPDGGPNGVKVPLDKDSEHEFDDNILHNIRDGYGAIQSDAVLYTNQSNSKTKSIIDSYIVSKKFKVDFVESVIKMGTLGVKTGSEGDIRRVCSRFN